MTSTASPDGDGHIERIAHEIERYLVAHPEAADTVSGIAQWWLVGEDEALADVERALESLVRRRVVAQKRLPDGSLL
jgi:hypothetical protein